MNFFIIAKKESDQDNFILWLLESFDSTIGIERDASIAFARCLINSCDARIDKLSIKYQPNFNEGGRPDFVIGIKTETKDYLILLEDKIDAPIKNDLSAYKNYLEENEGLFCSRFGLNSINLNPVYLVLKTGIITESDSLIARNSGYRLINATGFANVLREFSSHYLINSFVNKITIDDHELLVSFSNRKEQLFSWLATKFGKKFVFNQEDKSADFYIKDDKIYINVVIKSLIAGHVKIKLLSTREINTTYLHDWKVVKTSKMNPPVRGRGDLVLGNCEIIVLYNYLIKYFYSIEEIKLLWDFL